DRVADWRRQRAIAQPGRHFVRRKLRVAVLFEVGPVAEPVLEIDPEVFDRLARQLVDDAQVDAIGERGVETDRAGERRRVGRGILQRFQRVGAELLRRVRLGEMRAAVEDVRRLRPRRMAGKWLGNANVRIVERVDERRQRVLENARVAHVAGTTSVFSPPKRSSYATASDAPAIGAVTMMPTTNASTPTAATRPATMTRPSAENQCFVTTRRLNSIAGQKSSFLSAASGIVKM